MEDNNSSMDVPKNNTEEIDSTTISTADVDNHCQQESRDEPDPRSFFWPNDSSNKVSKSAKMTVEKNAMYYKMNHSKRGIAVILNHEQFEVHKLKQRSGTHVDKGSLEKTFKNLGFEVWSYTDLKYDEVQSVIKKASQYDHSDSDCFVLAVLTHGEQGILYAKDAPYDPQQLWSPFMGDRCLSLVGKPKIYFLQACQGDRLDGGVEVMMRRTETDSCPSYRIPIHADFLIAYSTVPGYYSWRNTTLGSWFVQALCEELDKYGFELDLLAIMTLVLRRVATDFESNVPNNPVMHNQKQMPYITTMLTRFVQFNRRK